VLERDGRIAELERRADDLQRFDASQPADLFAPVKIEIASLSGGVDLDDAPGDDGVRVHLRPRDADGYIVKAPGRVTVQLTDLTDPNLPRLLGVCVVDDAEALRKSWYGRFGTNHFTVDCPFAADVTLPSSRSVVVHAEFTGYLTGRTLTAVKEVAISIPGGEAAGPAGASD